MGKCGEMIRVWQPILVHKVMFGNGYVSWEWTYLLVLIQMCLVIAILKDIRCHRINWKFHIKICKKCFTGERKKGFGNWLHVGWWLHPGRYISKRHIYPWGAHGQPKMHTIEGYAFGYTRGSKFTNTHDPTFNGHGGGATSIHPPKMTYHMNLLHVIMGLRLI